MTQKCRAAVPNRKRPWKNGRAAGAHILQKALNDPESVFASPEAVADHPTLPLGQKVEILRRWEYDATEAAVASEEGMAGRDPDLLHRILKTLDRLTGGVDVRHVGDSKQHGLIAPR